MNLEFVEVTNGTAVDIKDIYDFQIPQSEELSGIDTFVTKFNLTSGIMFPEQVGKWMDEHKDVVHDPDTYRQLDYGCIDLKYRTFDGIRSSKKKQQLLIKSYGSNYEFLKGVYLANRSKVFFGVQGDHLIFNMFIYDSKDPEKLYPNFIFKIPVDVLSQVISMDFKFNGGNTKDHYYKAFESFEIKDDELEFVGLTRDAYNSLNLMARFGSILSKSPFNVKGPDIMFYVRKQAKCCIYMYIYFMLKLKYYLDMKPKNIKRITTSINIDDEVKNLEETQDEKHVVVGSNAQIIYLGEYDYVMADPKKAKIEVSRKSKSGYKIKHSFPVSGSEYYNYRGTHVVRKSYMKGKGLPPLNKQKIYIDDKKGGDTDDIR